MTMPSSYPLQLYHGDSYEWLFQLWLDSGKTQPLDLTNVTPKAEIRDKSGGSQIFTIDCTVILPNQISATLSATVSETLPIGPLVWDLQLTYPDGKVNTILYGGVTVTADVTDSGTLAPLAAVPPPGAGETKTISLRQARRA